jgi:hypothetical protein
MRSTHALEALQASKYRLRDLVIGGRWKDSTIDRRGGDAADGGPTLPGVRDECYRGDRCSSMSLACGHAHLNSGITTARNAPLENRDSQALGCMNETRRTRYCMAESTASSFFCRARLPSYAMGIVGRVSEAIIGSGRGPCSFMTLCSLSLTIKQDIKDLCVGGLDDRVMVACQTTH